MSRLRELKADSGRIQFWHPYPLLGVVELQAPDHDTTHWDFRLADQAMLDFYRASERRPVMVNFSTLPTWMFTTGGSLAPPHDPDEIDWSYNQGLELRDPSLTELKGYFQRIAEWYLKGGFKDEVGENHVSGHRLKFAYWEVLNEIDEEHKWSPEMYSRIYDAVVSVVKPIDPQIRFSALALADPAANLPYFRYFLSSANHPPGTPLDMISYHFYISAKKGEDIESLQNLFYQRADEVLATVTQIEAIRQQLSPKTKTYINELGTMWMDGKKVDGPPIPDRYWKLSSAVFAYTYLGLVRQGVDLVGSAELIDYPGQYAGTSLLNWENGQPFPRYYVTKALMRNIRVGDAIYTVHPTSGTVEAQAFGSGGRQVLVLINKLHADQQIHLKGFRATRVLIVAGSSKTPAFIPFSGNDLTLGPDAVAFLVAGRP